MSNDATTPIMVTTKHRGVFAGLVPADQDMAAEVITLTECMMAIRFRHGRGVLGLADKGPGPNCKISAAAPKGHMRDITSVAEMTPEAWAKWQEVKS